jgi:hypothetical protein
MKAFLATVQETYTKLPTDKKIDINSSLVPKYNDNKSYIESGENAQYLGAIKFKSDAVDIKLDNTAYPLDKNNLTYPLVGETVMILDFGYLFFWMPYSVSLYPNFREDKQTSNRTETKKPIDLDTKNTTKDYNSVKDGTPNATPKNSTSNKSDYKINEKVKFLKPLNGDTILSGRVGNTIRFSEFYLTEDDKTSSPGIFIRNRQNRELDNKPIGTLVEEDINKDGTSIYVTSEKIKVPFKESVKKRKIAFTKYPNSTDFTGDQLFINSDRIVLSAKAKEFIIFGKGNTGVITDGRYTIDAAKEIYAHSDTDIVLHTNKNIVLNSDSAGVVYVGKVGKPGGAGAPVQRMVLAGELIEIMGELIDELCAMVFATPVGPTSAGSHNLIVFKSIKSKLSKIQSSRNFLSK